MTSLSSNSSSSSSLWYENIVNLHKYVHFRMQVSAEHRLVQMQERRSTAISGAGPAVGYSNQVYFIFKAPAISDRGEKLAKCF